MSSNLDSAYKTRKRRMKLSMDAATKAKPGQGVQPGASGVLPKNVGTVAKPAGAVPKLRAVQNQLASAARRTAPTTKAPNPFKPRRKRAR